MDIIHAIILGVIEGLTEFLPISSTGHLIVAENLINYKDTAEIFTIVCQIGAIIAVIWYYRRDLLQKISGFFSGDKKSQKFIYKWVLATLPALIFGFLLKDYFDKYAVVRTVAISFILGGVAIWLIEHYHKAPKSKDVNLEKITLTQSLKIGFYQVIALVPGVSRSGATIMGGLLSGVDRVSATAFSFYLSIPIIVLASGYKLTKNHSEISTVSGGGLALLVGVITAFITAFFAIKWLLKYVSKHDFKGFAYYRIIVGIIILVFIV